MNILILEIYSVFQELKQLKKNYLKLLLKKIDFVIANGENAADNGLGITKKNTEDFLMLV